MNRNTLIGFSLIAVVLILFSYLNTPSQEQIDAYNHQQDSIAAVKQQQAAKTAQQDSSLPQPAVVADSTEMREFALCVTGAVKVKKGKLRILPWNRDLERHYKKKKGVVLASGPLLLEKGRYADLSTCDSGFVATKHPRSAIAVTKDKRVLFITVDGRSPGNALGMRLPELAHLIKVMGGKEALNLDGGGSTMLYLDGEILNHPSDNGRFDHQGERRIPNIIYYYYKK